MADGRSRGEDLYLEQVRFGQEEQKRRRNSKVHVCREEYEHLVHPDQKAPVFLVDPRLDFNNRTHRFWINTIPPGGEEGAGKIGWKTLGHRHTVEAVIYWLKGRGYSVIDGVRYDWKAGDLICVPMFAWHRHVNHSDEHAVYVASTTGPLSMGIGQAVYEDERYPQYFVFAQEGEQALRSLVPGGAERGEGGDLPANGETRLYAEELAFAYREEELRRKSRVLVKAEEIVYEPTPMGRTAHVVDARRGFHSKVLATVMAEVLPGKRSGAHRHLYDEIDYVLEGTGRVVIDDRTYEVRQGDVLAIPVFAWHQYFNTGDVPLRFLSHNTRPALENLGLMLSQQGEPAD